jgi:ribose 5-phosphate isomerase B
MKIAFGNDHAGFRVRKETLDYLYHLGIEIIDLGNDSPNLIDFPVLSRKVCKLILEGKAEKGILLCGSGLGAAMAANKYQGIRAGVCHDSYSAHQGVEHDNMNILCIGGQIIGPWLIGDIIDAFVNAKFKDTEDFVRRVGMLDSHGEKLI